MCLPRLCRCDDAADWRVVGAGLHAFTRITWDFVVMLGAAVGFLLFLALAADGAFVDHERFVYMFWTYNATGAVNETFFGTLDAPLPGVPGCNGSGSFPVRWNDTELWVNFTRTIPPGSLANQTWTLMIPGYPNLSGLGVIWVGAMVLAGLCTVWVRWPRLPWERSVARLLQLAVGGAALAVAAFVPEPPLQPLPNGTDDYGLPLSIFFAGAPGFAMTVAVYIAMAAAFANGVFCYSRIQASRNGMRDIEDAACLPELLASSFIGIQLPLVLSNMDPFSEDRAPWASALTPSWVVLVLNLAGWAVWFVAAIDDDILEEDPGRAWAVMLSVPTLHAATAASLILVCQNDGLEYAQNSQWPHPWTRAVLPLLVAWLLLCGLALTLPCFRVADCSRRCRLWVLEARRRHARVEAEYDDRVVSAEDAQAALISPRGRKATVYGFEESDGGGEGAGPCTPEEEDAVRRFHRLFLAGPVRCHSAHQVAERLRRTRKAVSEHPHLLATAANRMQLIALYEGFRQLPGNGPVWTDEVARLYGLLLRMFTAAGQLLRRRPSLQHLRIHAKPPPPPASSRPRRF